MRLLLKEFKDYIQNSLNYSNYIAEEINRFGVGESAVYQAYYERVNFPHIFLLDKIIGEEPLKIYKLIGDKMEIEFEKEEFKRKLIEFGLNNKQISEVCNEFEKKENKTNVLVVISLLEKYGYARSVILGFLREIGIKEGDLIKLFSRLQRMKMGVEADKISKLVIKGEKTAKKRKKR